jgi:hypothetical protein
VVLAVQMLWLHGRESRSVLKTQVANPGQIISTSVWSQTGGMRRSGKRSVVGGGGQRIVRESRRGWSRAIGGIRSRPLHMSVSIVVVVLVRMRPCHGISGQRWEVVSAAVTTVAVIRVMSARAVWRMMRREDTALALDLRRRGGQHIDRAVVGASALTPSVAGQARGEVGSIVGKRMGGGDVG